MKESRLTTHAITNVFLRFAAAILIITALLKLVSAFGNSKILFHYDPIFGQKNRVVYAEVAGVEMMIAFYLLLAKNSFYKLTGVVWLCANFMFYRVGLAWMGVRKPCSCLGNAADWLPWLARNQEFISWTLLVFLFMGSSVLLGVRRVAVRDGGTSSNPGKIQARSKKE